MRHQRPFRGGTDPDEVTIAIWERGRGGDRGMRDGSGGRRAPSFHRWGDVGQNVTVRMAGGQAQVDLSAPVTLTGESTHVAELDVASV